MAGFVTLLGAASVLLTFAGTYRFTRYFYRDDALYAGGIAGTLAITYVALFEYVLLLIGLLAFVAPVAAVYTWHGGRIPAPDVAQLSTPSSASRNVKGGSTSSRAHSLDAYGTPCPNCGKLPSGDGNFCAECGTELDGGQE